MKTISTALLLTMNLLCVSGHEMNKEYQKLVYDFIDCFKSNDHEELVAKTIYPFERTYPIPEIKNSQEFLKRYTEVFDDSLVEKIIKAGPSVDWSEVAWRCVMLFDGVVWLNQNGNLISVNYQTKVEKRKREELIRLEKKTLDESLQKFKQPICIIETSTFQIRFDDLGEGNFRYASWALKNKMSDKPDLVIKNGEYIPEGSGGNHIYHFKNQDYVYDCSIFVLSEAYTPAQFLSIYKSGKEILSQKANKLLNRNCSQGKNIKILNRSLS